MQFNKIFFISIFLLIQFNGSSQSDSFTWSEKFNDDGHYTLLTETDDGVVALRKFSTSYPELDRDARLELIRFDNTLQITHAVELKNLEKSNYEDVGTIASPEGIAHIYYQTTKSGMLVVSAQLFDLEDLHKTEIVDLAQFKIKTKRNQRITELNEIDIYHPLDIVQSGDKSKLVIFYNQDQVGKRKETYYQYMVIDVANQFNILHKGGFYSDGRSDKYKVTDIDLSNNGELTYLLKKYKENIKTEFINRKPAYAYEVHHMVGDTTDYIYDIKTKGKFIDRLMVSSDDEGNVYVAGYLRKKPFGEITSSYFLGIDRLGYAIAESRDKYRPREIEEMQGKKDTELDDDFEIVDVMAGDAVVYVIKQYRRFNTTQQNNNIGLRNSGFGNNRIGNNGFNNLNYDWDFEELVVEGFSKNSGEMMWSVTNPRRQEENQQYVRSFITGYNQLIGSDLYLFYNERADNVERLRKKDKLKWTNMPGDQSEPVIVRVNSEGDIKYRSLKGEKRYHVPKTGVLVGQQNFYLIHSKSNYDKYMIGKTNGTVLDF
ncbi:MAG: hypothetical protein ACJATI_000734 [Halioglobus sp.]|jgi:hypothetical protein